MRDFFATLSQTKRGKLIKSILIGIAALIGITLIFPPGGRTEAVEFIRIVFVVLAIAGILYDFIKKP